MKIAEIMLTPPTYKSGLNLVSNQWQGIYCNDVARAYVQMKSRFVELLALNQLLPQMSSKSESTETEIQLTYYTWLKNSSTGGK